MLLNFTDNSPFAIGAASYDYSGDPASEAFTRIVLDVVIAGQHTAAILDTGAPYLVCSPALAEVLRLDPGMSLGDPGLSCHGQTLPR
jgi:hypothetical protein